MATNHRTEIALMLRSPPLECGALVEAALQLLDARGIEAVTLPQLADAVDMDPAELHARFPSRQQLLVAIAEAVIGDLADTAQDQLGWRDHLRQRGIALRDRLWAVRDGALLVAHAGLPQAGDQLLASITVLGNDGFSPVGARAALMLVDRFALGAAATEQATGTPNRAAHQPFRDQLEVILNGIAVSHGIDDDVSVSQQQAMFQPRLWNLLRSARESADIAYSRTMQLSELDRRILLLLNSRGEVALVQLAAATGTDKAQVSRACKRLSEQKLVERRGVRSPLRLSATGGEIAEGLVRLAALRDRELTFGVSDEELGDVFAVLEELMHRSVRLYEQERQLANAARLDGEDAAFGTVSGLPSDALMVDRTRILPPLMTLCTYMLRSAALAYKRLTGLSRFESWVLSEISGSPPLEWSSLVQILHRDHSQAARTVNRLLELGLVSRSGGLGRRDGSFSPTEEGHRMFCIICKITARRSEFLMQDIPPAKLKRFLNAFETVLRNAEAQLARERALQQAGQG